MEIKHEHEEWNFNKEYVLSKFQELEKVLKKYYDKSMALLIKNQELENIIKRFEANTKTARLEVKIQMELKYEI